MLALAPKNSAQSGPDTFRRSRAVTSSLPTSDIAEAPQKAVLFSAAGFVVYQKLLYCGSSCRPSAAVIHVTVPAALMLSRLSRR